MNTDGVVNGRAGELAVRELEGGRPIHYLSDNRMGYECFLSKKVQYLMVVSLRNGVGHRRR